MIHVRLGRFQVRYIDQKDKELVKETFRKVQIYEKPSASQHALPAPATGSEIASQPPATPTMQQRTPSTPIPDSKGAGRSSAVSNPLTLTNPARAETKAKAKAGGKRKAEQEPESPVEADPKAIRTAEQVLKNIIAQLSAVLQQSKEMKEVVEQEGNHEWKFMQGLPMYKEFLSALQKVGEEKAKHNIVKKLVMNRCDFGFPGDVLGTH